MTSRILIGVDGAQGGVDALALARRLAPDGAELVAVTVVVLERTRTRGANLDYDRSVREAGMTLLAEVGTQHDDVQGHVVEAVSVARGLHRATEHFGADLLVLGSCRRGPIGRTLAGDDVRATLRGAPCPVAVAPREYALREHAITTIGLGWDDSAEAVEALRFARVLADGTGAELHALNVTPAPLWPAPATPGGYAERFEHEHAERWSARLAGVPVAAVVGDPRDGLAAFAAEVDVLVVGSSQRGLLGRIAMGSISEALAQRSTRPLVVVPRAPRTGVLAPSPAGSATARG